MRALAAAVALAIAVTGSQALAQQTKKSSVSQLQAEIARDPNNPKLHIELGLAYWDRNDYPRALEAFQRAVKVGPRVAEAHNWLGVALSEKADLPGAISEFKQAVELDPKYGRALHQPGSGAGQERRLHRGRDGVPQGARARARQPGRAPEPRSRAS